MSTGWRIAARRTRRGTRTGTCCTSREARPEGSRKRRSRPRSRDQSERALRAARAVVCARTPGEAIRLNQRLGYQKAHRPPPFRDLRPIPMRSRFSPMKAPSFDPQVHAGEDFLDPENVVRDILIGGARGVQGIRVPSRACRDVLDWGHGRIINRLSRRWRATSPRSPRRDAPRQGHPSAPRGGAGWRCRGDSAHALGRRGYARARPAH